MDPLNTVFVEGTTDDQALEYAGLIDELNGTKDSDNSFQNQTQALINDKKWDEIYENFSNQVSTLLKVEVHNIVASFNLLIAQLKLANVDSLPKLVNLIVESLLNAEAENGLSKLAMLEILYNSLEKSSWCRYKVFEGIVNVSRKHKVVKTLLPSLDSIKNWVGQWGINKKDAQSLYLNLSETLREAEFSKEAFEFLIHYLYTFDKEDNIGEDVVQVSEKAIIDAIRIPEVLNFEPLLLSVPIQQLKGKPLYSFSEIFLHKDVSDYLEFTKQNPDLIPKYGLDESAALNKVRLLTVASLGTKHLGKPISYSTIAEAINIPLDDGYETEIEVYIIDVIRAGLVEAKLNQLESSVTITRSTYREFAHAHWAKLAAELSSWKDSLEQVVKTVQNSTNSIKSQSQALSPTTPELTLANEV